MDAIIFDFDGVIIDSEPAHMRCFQQVLSGLGVELSREDYYSHYLGYDDHDCFMHVLSDNGRPVTQSLLAELTARKTSLVHREFEQSIRALPGAVELLRAARQADIPVAVCSGALLQEIELAARTVGAADYLMTIVAAQDVARGKPDPEGYRLALSRLTDLTHRQLAPTRTWIVEDSPAGIAAGKAAGMKALAVTTSYEAASLSQADRIVRSLADVSLADFSGE